MIGKRILGAVSLMTLPFLILLVVLPLLGGEPATVEAEALTANLQRGRYPQALYQVTALADREGWTPDRLRLAGDLWRELGDLTRALPYWEAAHQHLPDDPVLMHTLAEAYLMTQRWPHAVDQLHRLVELDAGDAWAHYHLGLLRAAYDPQAATAHLQAASQTAAYRVTASRLLAVLDSQAEDLLLGMPVGLVLAEAELWPYAEVAFQHAVDMSPVYPEALAYTGLARDHQGKDGGAWVARALALDPQNPVVRFIEGLHLRHTGDLQGSLDALVQAVALDPQNPAYYAELGTAYHLTGDLENAERWLRVAVDVSNQAAEFQRLLALFYAQEAPGLTSGGMSDLEMVATLMPDDPEVQASLGWARYGAGDTQAALEYLDAVLEVVPDHPRSLYYKARIALESERWDDARALLERLVTLNSPFQTEAVHMLDSLGGMD